MVRQQNGLLMDGEATKGLLMDGEATRGVTNGW